MAGAVRRLRRNAGVLLPILGIVALVASAGAATNSDKLAKLLAKKDPGARVGGNTIVATGTGDDVYAVPDRINFIIALGKGEKIHGASASDQIGAIGKGVKLVASNRGHSLIVAGPESEVAVSGKGDDLVFSHAKGAKIVLESPGDEVIANGPHDQIVCAKHSSHELIEVAKGETVSKSCQGHHDQIEHLSNSSLSVRSAAARAHAATECGSLPRPVDCTVTTPEETIGPNLWEWKAVPGYSCPGDRVLENHNYAPPGTTLLRGVEVTGLGPVGVYIGAGITRPDLGNRYVGIRDGTATNWVGGAVHRYTVILHCTDDLSRGYQ